jgi:hypothetical protein
VAQHIVAALEQDRKDVYLGWPERLFVRVNSVLPRLVDAALGRQARLAERLLEPQAGVERARHPS